MALALGKRGVDSTDTNTAPNKNLELNGGMDDLAKQKLELENKLKRLEVENSKLYEQVESLKSQASSSDKDIQLFNVSIRKSISEAGGPSDVSNGKLENGYTCLNFKRCGHHDDEEVNSFTDEELTEVVKNTQIFYKQYVEKYKKNRIDED